VHADGLMRAACYTISCSIIITCYVPVRLVTFNWSLLDVSVSGTALSNHQAVPSLNVMKPHRKCEGGVGKINKMDDDPWGESHS
jgi:hypothetical protein